MPDTADNYEKIVDEGSQDEKGTVEELFEDEDDEFEVEIVEYVDMVDEGYYTPSDLFLGILLLLVLLVGAGVVVLVYFAIDDRFNNETKSVSTLSPTMAPTLVNMTPDFICNVCAPGEEITIPDALVDIVGEPKCLDLQEQGESGWISPGQCGIVQDIARESCGCKAPNAEPCTVCAVGVVQNASGIIDVSSAGFPGFDVLTCGQLDNFAAQGRIPLEFCPLLQNASVQTCACGEAPPSTPESCKVCASGVVRNPDGVLNVTAAGFPGVNMMTCGSLLTVEADGIIPVEFCSALQEASLETCDCGTTESNNTVLELLASVVGEAVYEAGTSEYLAARYLIEEDPRFLKSTGRRRVTPFTTLQEQPGGFMERPSDGGPSSTLDPESNATAFPFGGGTLPNLPLNTQDPQSNATDVPITASNPVSEKPEASPFDTGSNVTDPIDETTTSTASDTVAFSDLTEEQILQRYLLILLYFQTSNNRASRWATKCAAVTTAEGRRQLQNSTTCSFRGNQEASRWLSQASECDWAGVTCSDATGQVQSLELSKFGLTGSLPTQILALPSLSVIDFSVNNLTGSLAKSLFPSNSSRVKSSDLPSSPLKTWLLGRNSLSGSLPTEIAKFSNLQVIELFKNKLEGSIPSQLASLVNLTLLDLSGNALRGVIPTELGLLGNIRRMLLFENSLTGDIPSELSNLSRLQILNLAKNNFTTQVVDDLCGLTSTIIGVDCGTVSCECCSCCDDKNCEGDVVL